MANKKITTNDDLAIMIKKGFEGVDKRFGETDKKIDNLSIELIKGFEENTKEHQQIFNRLENLERGHEEIKLKLDQVAYRFEIEELDRRLKKVEAKLGIQ